MECIVQISARAFQRVFTCKIWLRYSRERAYLISLFLVLPWSFNFHRGLPPRSHARKRYSGYIPQRLSEAAHLDWRTPQAAQVPSSARLRGVRVSKIGKNQQFFTNFANFWRARSRLYQNEFLQENMRLTAFFKLYKICILLHICNLTKLAKDRFEKSAIFVEKKFSKILQN